jgi:hypothetical protein
MAQSEGYAGLVFAGLLSRLYLLSCAPYRDDILRALAAAKLTCWSKCFGAPSKPNRSAPFVPVRVRTFARRRAQNDRAATRSTPESTCAAGNRERRGEAVALTLEIRTF